MKAVCTLRRSHRRLWVVQMRVGVAAADHRRANGRKTELLLYGSGGVQNRVIVKIVSIQSKRNRAQVLRLRCECSRVVDRLESVIVERRFVCGALGRNTTVGHWRYLG